MFFSRNFMARSCLCYRSLSIGSTSCPYTGFFGRRSKTKYQYMAVFVVGMRGLGKKVDFTSWTLWSVGVLHGDFVVQSSVSRRLYNMCTRTSCSIMLKRRISFYLSTLVSGKVLLMPVVSNVW